MIGIVENMSGFLCPCCGTKTDIFPAAGAGPAGMAAAFNVPFLGALPLDPLLLSSCESGEAYVTKHPRARGVAPFLAVTAAIVKQVEGEEAILVMEGGEHHPDHDGDAAPLGGSDSHHHHHHAAPPAAAIAPVLKE